MNTRCAAAPARALAALACAAACVGAACAPGRAAPPQSAEPPRAAAEPPSPADALAIYPQLLVVSAPGGAVPGAVPGAASGNRSGELTLPYTDALVDDWAIADERSIGIAELTPDGAWRWLPARVDPAANLASARVDATAAAWTAAPSWMIRLWQQRAIVGAPFTPHERNALIIHGWNNEPWDACMLQLAAGIAPAYDNVAAAAYPSALDISGNADWLRAEIARRWTGVSFDIIAFSEGGLVARAAIEPAAGAAGAAALPADARPRRLMTIATPHEGVLASGRGAVMDDEAGRQMRPGSAFLRGLNSGPAPAGTAYYAIAGDMGNGTDGIIAVDSALGAGLFTAGTTATLHLPHAPPSPGARSLPCDEQVYDVISGWAAGPTP